MFETPITVVGTVVNDPVRRHVGDREVFKFRIASNSRRRTPDGGWEAGESLYANVDCWAQRLITGAGAALGKGSAVIVVGTVSLAEYSDRDGNPRSSVEIRATSVGVDLSRSLVRVEARIPADRPAGTDANLDGNTDDAATAVAVAAGSGDADVTEDGAAALPLSA